MAGVVETELASLPAELRFLSEANTTDIIDWFYGVEHGDNEAQDDVFPTLWHLVEKRLQQHPTEARETGAYDSLPIHNILWLSQNGYEAPLSLVQLLIELHPEALNIRDEFGKSPLHYAAIDSDDLDCFRAILYNGSVETTTVEGTHAETPFYRSTDQYIGLAILWELICYNREYITVQGVRAMAVLHHLERHQETDRLHATRQNAKIVLVKMAVNYNHVPPVPSDEMILIVESHPVCTVLAPRLEPGNDASILHQALAARCPPVLVEALVQIFPNQVQQEYTMGRLPLHIALQHVLGASVRALVDSYPAAMSVADPVTGLLPIEQAILNVGNDGSLGNVDAVNTLLRANPAFLSRIEHR